MLVPEGKSQLNRGHEILRTRGNPFSKAILFVSRSVQAFSREIMFVSRWRRAFVREILLVSPSIHALDREILLVLRRGTPIYAWILVFPGCGGEFSLRWDRRDGGHKRRVSGSTWVLTRHFRSVHRPSLFPIRLRSHTPSNSARPAVVVDDAPPASQAAAPFPRSS